MSIQQQLMRVHDAEHDFKNSLFKVVGYEIGIQLFSGPQISYWLMVGWSVISAFGWWFVSRWSVVGGRLVG